MVPSTRSLGLAVTLALAASACATAPTPVAVMPMKATAPPAPPTLDGAWSLALLRDAPPEARVAATLKIHADHAEGATECRSWTATASTIGMDLRFDALADQPLGCDSARQKFDEKVLAALKDVRMAQMRAGYLVLMDERGRERLYFARGS